MEFSRCDVLEYTWKQNTKKKNKLIFYVELYANS